VSHVDGLTVFSIQIIFFQTVMREHNNPINHDWIGGHNFFEHIEYGFVQGLVFNSLDD
jgi:hypothetical protein